MGQPHEPAPEDPPTASEGPAASVDPTASEDPTDATQPLRQDADGDEEQPTKPVPTRWTGSATVPPPGEKRRRWRLFPERETTEELPTAEDEEPWPPPPPPRPANAPVTAPYPPPQPPAWNPPRQPAWNPPRQPPARWPTPVPFYPPGYRPRRRRWPWVLGTLALLFAVCCGCCLALLQPYAEQYPATATLPPQAANLVKLDDQASVATAAELKGKVRSRYVLAEDVFAAVYAEPQTARRQVVIFGATLLLLDPEKDLKAGFNDMTGDLGLTDIQAVDPGPAGGHQRCATGRRDGQPLAVCGWADHGSIAIGVFFGRSAEESAELLRQLRTAIITRE